jgi:hypothetical protein
MKHRVSACVLILACLAGSAAAQSPRDRDLSSKYSAFDPLVTWANVWGDTTGRGVYTCEEWKQYAAKLFNGADRNRDGYLDKEEFAALRKADPMLKDAEIGYFDDNRDGRVSRAEFVDKPNPFFARYDRKGTCRVTLDDLSATSTRRR